MFLHRYCSATVYIAIARNSNDLNKYVWQNHLIHCTICINIKHQSFTPFSDDHVQLTLKYKTVFFFICVKHKEYYVKLPIELYSMVNVIYIQNLYKSK